MQILLLDERFIYFVFFILKFSTFTEMKPITQAQCTASRTSSWNTEDGTVLPGRVTLDILTDLETFVFELRLNTRHFQRIPVLTNDGNDWQRYNFEMERNGLGVYGTKDASFVLKFTDDKMASCKGFFYSNYYLYTVHPNDVNSTSHVIHRQRHWTLEFPAEQSHPLTSDSTGMYKQTEILRLKTTNSVRRKRQAQLYEIELLIVLDFALFTQLSASFSNTNASASNRRQDVLEDIAYQFAIIVNSIDARFKGIQSSGYVLDIVFVGIYIAQDQKSSSWSESVKEASSTRPVISEKSIKLFTEWIKAHQHNLPEFDHAMAFTAYNLRKEDNHKTLGLGYRQSMCTDRRFSIVEHHGDIAYVSYIATHELAHSLGAKHDGYPARVVYGERVATCGADDGYIMCPKASRDPDAHQRKWHFSDCSVLYFDFFLDYLNENKSNCLTKRSSWHRENDSTMYIDDDPRAYSPDEQCSRKHGAGSVLDRKAFSVNISSICLSIPCINPRDRDSVIPTLPLEGTVCGHGKVCHYGRCIDVDGNSRSGKVLSDDECVFGDQPGDVPGTGRTCTELLGSANSAYRCYTYEKQCCRTCSWHRRQFTATDTCPYGDRKETCSVTDCGTMFTGLCCETCALAAGLLKKCPVLHAPDHGLVHFNTNTNCHGTIARFSCEYGHHVAGNKTATCLQDGIWDSAVPTCVKGCLIPELSPQTSIENTFKDAVYIIGSKINFKCENGLVLEGNVTAECKEDTSWSSVVPNCILVFTSAPVVQVLENTPPGSVVHQLSTATAVSGYKLLYYSHPGFVVTEDGKVVVDDGGDIDFEEVQSYSVIIEATSKTDTRIKARQRLVIHVQDVNEFEPDFKIERGCIFLHKPYIDGMIVLRVSGSDQDASGLNISYEIRNSAEIADAFRIDYLTGVITITNSTELSKSKTGEYLLEIQGVDSGTPRLTGTCAVRIELRHECLLSIAPTLFQISSQNYIAIFYIVLYNVYVYILFFKRNHIR